MCDLNQASRILSRCHQQKRWLSPLKYLPWMHEHLSSDPRYSQIRRVSNSLWEILWGIFSYEFFIYLECRWHSSPCLWPQCWADCDRHIPGAPWPANLVEPMSSRLDGKPIFNASNGEQWETTLDMDLRPPHACVHICICTGTNIWHAFRDDWRQC